MQDNPRTALTKRLLQEGLLRLLREKDIRSVNVSQLCAEAGINRSTFYKHYGSPTDVLDDLAERLFEQLSAQIHSRERSFEGDVEEMCRFIQTHADTVRLLIRNHNTMEVPRFASRLLEQMGDRYADYIAQYDAESLRLLTTFLCYGSYHMIRQWLLDGMPKSPAEIAALVCQVQIQGWDYTRIPPVPSDRN
ncbi:MAG: TetR/AcrR family transcriptional regulator [Candidatus Faecivicinus sp.]